MQNLRKIVDYFLLTETSVNNTDDRTLVDQFVDFKDQIGGKDEDEFEETIYRNWRFHYKDVLKEDKKLYDLIINYINLMNYDAIIKVIYNTLKTSQVFIKVYFDYNKYTKENPYILSLDTHLLTKDGIVGKKKIDLDVYVVKDNSPEPKYHVEVENKALKDKIINSSYIHFTGKRDDIYEYIESEKYYVESYKDLMLKIRSAKSELYHSIMSNIYTEKMYT